MNREAREMKEGAHFIALERKDSNSFQGMGSPEEIG